MTRNTLLYQFEGTQLACYALFLLALQFGTVREVLAIHKLRDPTQASLNRRCCVVQVITIEAEAHFQTQGVAGTQANRFDAFGFAGFKDSIPNLLGIFYIEIEFKATCTCVACIGDDDILATGKLTCRKGN